MPFFLFPALLITLFWVGCGNSVPKASEGFATDRYVSLTDDNNHTVIRDFDQHLLFVNSKQGCKALHGETGTAKDSAQQFCQNLTFFGHSNWRVPTLKEIQSLSKGMDEEGLIPYFTFPECKRITGLKPDGTLGAINTHNGTPKFAEVPPKLPAGVRCVREDDL